jgi:LytTr DNA-binding domain
MAELDVVVCVAFDHRADVAGLANFKKCIAHCDFVDVTMEVSGTFNLIVQGKVPTLEIYTEQMDRIGPQLAEFVTRVETNFVAKKIERHLEAEKFMWVPCVGGRKRIDVGMIDKVVAEGDYMRLYVHDWSCLIHSTIRALSEQLDLRFIQLHRSSIVRIDFIDRLIHHERRWIARLLDGSEQAVAKSHVVAVLDLMAHDSSKGQGTSAKSHDVAEPSLQANEMQMHGNH